MLNKFDLKYVKKFSAFFFKQDFDTLYLFNLYTENLELLLFKNN